MEMNLKEKGRWRKGKKKGGNLKRGNFLRLQGALLQQDIVFFLILGKKER
jgi:hypothetical protein